MDEKGGATLSQPRKRIGKYGREARAARILKRLRDGLSCEEVAREEGLNVRRVRQIAAAAIKGREAAADLTHAHLQVDRLGFAVRVAPTRCLLDSSATKPLKTNVLLSLKKANENKRALKESYLALKGPYGKQAGA